jgi:hypothetical protein
MVSQTHEFEKQSIGEQCSTTTPTNWREGTCKLTYNGEGLSRSFIHTRNLEKLKGDTLSYGQK